MDGETEALATHSRTLSSYIWIWVLNPDLSGTKAYTPVALFQLILSSLNSVLTCLFFLNDYDMFRPFLLSLSFEAPTPNS